MKKNFVLRNLKKYYYYWYTHQFASYAKVFWVQYLDPIDISIMSLLHIHLVFFFLVQWTAKDSAASRFISNYLGMVLNSCWTNILQLWFLPLHTHYLSGGINLVQDEIFPSCVKVVNETIRTRKSIHHIIDFKLKLFLKHHYFTQLNYRLILSWPE